jgi:hypothetical protein
VEWDSSSLSKADPSLKSFLFTLKNPPNVSARRFTLKAEKQDKAIPSVSECGPDFKDICDFDHCNVNIRSGSCLGFASANDTGLDGGI